LIPLEQDGRALTAGEREALRVFVEKKGLVGAAKALELGRDTIARLLATLPVKRETIAHVRAKLEGENHGRTDESPNSGRGE